ncbi:MAG: TonB-dependent receptor [Bacteroidales bacterium]|nr:TonB-dependent receptor [Candidatus Liminaster caballi]
MRKLVTTLLLSLLFIGLNAQGRYSVKGTIIDRETTEPVMGANVQLLSLPDSTFVKGAAAGEDGTFEIHRIPKGRYAVKITFIGYVSHIINYTPNDKKGNATDLGFLPLTADVRMLKEAEVSANAAKMQVDGDSLVFNAAAFRVPEGSTLEALIKLLPGAKIDSEGKITINGKSVTKILVDGKEFFLNDMNVAMKNIPTSMVDRIKSYERKSDLSRITGIDDGEEETVLDLSVKKGMKRGWLGDVNGSVGTNHRYEGRYTVTRFAETFKVVLLGSAKNTPDRWGRGNGLVSRKESGANFATTSDKFESGGSVHYSYNGSDRRNASTSEDFAAEVGRFSQRDNHSISNGHNFNTQFRMEWKPDTLWNIIFRPNLTISNSNGRNTSWSGSFNDKLDIESYADVEDADYEMRDLIVNLSQNISQNHSENLNANGQLQVNRRFTSKRGRNLTMRVTGGASSGENRSVSAAHVDYRTRGTETFNNRFYDTPSRSHNVNARLSYSEPIADRTYLQLSYQYAYSYNKNDRTAQVYDEGAYESLRDHLYNYRYDVNGMLHALQDAGILPIEDSPKADSLSQFSEYRNNNQTITLQLRRVRKEYNFSVGVDALPQHSTLNYRYMGKEYPEVSRSVFNIAPNLFLRRNFSKNTNLRIRYNGRTSQPSMTSLLDVVDDSDPLRVSRGNPGLKPSFTQNINANFNTSNPESLTSFWSWANGSMTSNQIANKTTYDDNGIRTTMPMNINGNWNIGGGVGTNIGLGKNKYYSVGGSLGTRYNNRVGFYSNRGSKDEAPSTTRSITNDIRINADLNTAYRNDIVNFELRGTIDYNNADNNVNKSAKRETYDFSYGADMQWTMPWGTELASDIYMTSRRGYTQASMNTDELLWNASVSHAFLRDKSLIAKIEIFDLLGQRTNISRTISAFSQSDSRTNAIYQYAMFSVIYKFKLFDGK